MARSLTADIKTFYVRGLSNPVGKLIELWKWDREYTAKINSKKKHFKSIRKLDKDLKKLLQTHNAIRKFPLYWATVWVIALYVIYMMGFMSHQLNLFGTRGPLPK